MNNTQYKETEEFMGYHDGTMSDRADFNGTTGVSITAGSISATKINVGEERFEEKILKQYLVNPGDFISGTTEAKLRLLFSILK